MKKNNSYLNITEVNRKFYFGKSYLSVPFEGSLFSKVALKKEYNEGVELSKPSEEFDVLSLHYKGLLKVIEEDDVKEGTTLSVSGSIRKKYLTSPVSGTVAKIDESSKTIEIKYKVIKDHDGNFKSTLMPVKGKIVQKLEHHIIIEFEALSINLFALKGSDAAGALQYIDSAKFLKDEASIDDLDLRDKIVFTETLTAEAAARLSAMGAKGILVYYLDYNIFSSIMTLAMPIGIIGGYDKLEPDKHFESMITKLEGSKIIIDSLYEKVHILTHTEPNWLVD